jgi:hypothetical protein
MATRGTLWIALLVAGCGPGDSGPDDLAALDDLAVPTVDDLALPTGGSAQTGDPCTRSSDCMNGPKASERGRCLMQTGTSMMFTWPGGYCANPCKESLNDPSTGLNPDCPGAGTCGGGACWFLCTTSSDCRDANYACFIVAVRPVVAAGCQLKAFSQCDPKVRGSCNIDVDGGSDGDGGSELGRTCVNVGDGTVGNCVPGCDPFTNSGCLGSTNPACHASDVTGEGLCVAAAAANQMAGSSCGNLFSDCPGGYGCLNGKCWRYCDDANAAAQCSPGASCRPFSTTTTVPTAIAGICSMSP